MEDKELTKAEPMDLWARIILVQAICVTILLLSVLAVKTCFPDCYTEVKAWIEVNFGGETSISEVLEPDGGENYAV